MSVFTEVTKNELDSYLKAFDLGTVVNFKAISAGVTNSNYFVCSTEKKLILTIYEQQSVAELEQTADMLKHFCAHGLACPQPYADTAGNVFFNVRGKPAAFMPFFPGETLVASANITQLTVLGESLARLHLAGLDYQSDRANPRAFVWMAEAQQKLQAISEELRPAQVDLKLITDELSFQKQQTLNIPKGFIHADLFQDNVLFDGDNLTAILDFDYLCQDYLMLDIAVVINDWCLDEDKQINKSQCEALLISYNKVRDINQKELQALPVLLRRAALRFYLSRCLDKFMPKPGVDVLVKDPDEFKQILLARRAQHDISVQLDWLELPLSGIRCPSKEPSKRNKKY